MLRHSLASRFATLQSAAACIQGIPKRFQRGKQRCLVHLLRDLYGLCETLPAIQVTRHIQPLVDLFQDAIALGHRREKLSQEAFDDAHERILERFWICLDRHSTSRPHPPTQARLSAKAGTSCRVCDRTLPGSSTALYWSVRAWW